MIDLPLEMPERTVFSDSNHAIVGRALAYATQFEATCRSFAGLLEVELSRRLLDQAEGGDAEEEDDEERIDRLLRAMQRSPLKVHIDRLGKLLGLPVNVSSVIHEAREARNLIAHELTLCFSHQFENDVGRERLRDEVGNTVSKIARAYLLVVALIGAITGQEEYACAWHVSVDSYYKRVVDWVCEVAED